MLVRTVLRQTLALRTTSRLAKRFYVQPCVAVRVVLRTVSTSVRSFATTPRGLRVEVRPYLLADVGEGITECEVVRWFVTEGEQVDEFDPICEVQSDKASVEITSRFKGRVIRLMHNVGDVARVGEALCEIEMQVEAQPGDAEMVEVNNVEAEAQAQAQAQGGKRFVSAQEKLSGVGVLATPAVRRVSREYNVDLANVRGTGRDGRITKEDVLNHIQNASPSPSPSASVSASASSSVNTTIEASTTTEEIALTPMQRAMFKAMTATLTTPHFAYSDEIDVTDLSNLRTLLSTPSTKLTLLPLLIKALSLSLHSHPLFLSTLTPNQTLLRRSTHDISIALTTPTGLVTPCLPNIQTKTILDIASSITHLQTLASTTGLTPIHLKPTGTITLSNIGAIGGGTYTHPLLPPTGQLAIGALGRVKVLPRFASEIPSFKRERAQVEVDSEPDTIVRRLIMAVSFTADHRVVQGADLARLVNRWKQLVENPSLWLGVLI